MPEPTRPHGRDPFRSLTLLSRRGGDVARYRAGAEPAFFVNRPDFIRHVLADHYRNYTKDTFVNQMFRTAVADGLLTSEGEAWHRQRRLMQPAFARDRVASFGGVIEDAVHDMLERWEGPSRDDGPMDMAAEMGALTLDVTARVLFGADISDRTSRIGAEISTGVAAIVSPDKPHFQEGLAEVRDLVLGIIEARRRSKEPSRDLLGILMSAGEDGNGPGMDSIQLRDQIVTLLLAGHETTANELAWTWYLVGRHPDAQRRLEAEVDGAERGEVSGLTFTRNLIEESLRMYPPAWILGRRAVNEDRLGEHVVPRASVIAMSPYTMHRHPAFWEDPDSFDPGRFAAHRAAGRTPFTYIPFGEGPRRCIGHNMAMFESQLIVAAIARRFRLTLPEGFEVEPERRFVLRPRHGLPMVVTPRT